MQMFALAVVLASGSGLVGCGMGNNITGFPGQGGGNISQVPTAPSGPSPFRGTYAGTYSTTSGSSLNLISAITKGTLRFTINEAGILTGRADPDSSPIAGLPPIPSGTFYTLSGSFDHSGKGSLNFDNPNSNAAAYIEAGTISKGTDGHFVSHLTDSYGGGTFLLDVASQ